MGKITKNNQKSYRVCHCEPSHAEKQSACPPFCLWLKAKPKNLAWRSSKKCILYVILALTTFILSSTSYAEWKPITTYVEHDYFQCEDVIIHSAKFNPSLITLQALVAPPPGNRAQYILDKTNSIIAINAGFFTPDLKPIGLIKSNNKILSKLHKTSWWSIFYIKNGVPYIKLPKNWKNSKHIEFAVQAGPRLIVSKKITQVKDNDSKTPRSAIGINEKNEVVLAIAPTPGLTLKEWANCLLKPAPQGPSLKDAMNLDGGSSSQMSIKYKDTQFDDHGLVPVPSFITVKSKK